ncbi:hypothetical protein AGABI2DRAFT_121011 [Agaricus bisporus var. bisporus H97]|uniref:hypothetical protein n=1 Tax=Agaricus bisporus var. bisporus (strain H97 / ATCC MYA-4626 / FGSC 10389) TaxID=936046 RepID=UPI00029F56B4|nr:hypothetical protein AGABI2DRAFT_121011 [Agaricus bisporus var. bisporus H97]EKV43797.1 hypothetical protein AGABI2DRAFT_121011 [Agaricus bisporus var. bisporus H97]
MSKTFIHSLDVWNEVLSHVEVSLEDDEKRIVEEKRKTILSIALLSRELTELSLNALWKNMTTLSPIVTVANSGGESFEYDWSGSWRITEQLEATPDFINNLIQNLKRVRNIRVQINKKELELWQILHAFLAPHSITYLLPCLRNLSLISPFGFGSDSFIGVIAYVLAPSLISITMTGQWPEGASWPTVQHFMNSHALPNLEELSYVDTDFNDFPKGITRLTGLRRLFFDNEVGFYHFDSLESLASLGRLQKLTIPVNELQFEKTSPISSTFHSLHELKLLTENRETLDLFLQKIKLPSLTSLEIIMEWPLDQMLGLDSINSRYPKLAHLTLSCFEVSGHSYKLTMDDLMAIINGREIESIKLNDVPHALGGADVVQLVGLLPKLHTLVIVDPKEIFPGTILTSLSQFSSLRHIELPLDFSPLTNDLLSGKTSQSRNWQLVKFASPHSVGLPDDASRKAILLRNMLHLFPNLEELGGQGQPMKELRDIFEVVKIIFHKPIL